MQETTYWLVVAVALPAWRIRLNDPCSAAMLPYVKLRRPLVFLSRNDTAAPIAKPRTAQKLHVPAYVDTTDGPPAATPAGPPASGTDPAGSAPKMSEVLGQLRRAQPATTTVDGGGEYSSIDLVKTAGR